MRVSRATRHALILLICSGLLTIASIVTQIQQTYGSQIVSPEAVDAAPVALVLGASVKKDGTPSDALSDRLKTAIRLYHAGKVSSLLVTGDDGKFHVDEVATMKRLAIEGGVPEASVLTDGHGYRTYESCKRAVQVFGVRQAIVVTQRFHLSRALFLCSHLGMEAQGVAADLQPYERIVFFTLRDFFSSVKAWWDVYIHPPRPPVEYE